MSGIIIINLIIIIIAIFLIGLFTPHLTRKEIIFGVRIPKGERDNKEIQRIRRVYTRNYLLTVGIPSLILIILQTMNTNPIIFTISCFVLLALFFGNYYFCHKTLRKLKADNQWTEGYQETSVIDMEYQPEKTLVSPWWFSIPFGLILIQIIIAINHYDSMPDIVPIHYDINGNPDNWAKKSYRLLFMQPAIEILLTALLFFIYKVIGWSKQQLSAENPEESRTRNQIFRRRWSAFIILFNVLIIIPSFLLHLFTLQLIKIHPGSSLFGIFSFVPLILILILTGWIAFKTGQSGSRIKLKNKSEPDEKKVDRDDDKYWKGGIIYHNPDDPAIFVEQRFGVGWTINFGNRKALIGFFGFLVLFPAALFLIARIAIKQG